MKRWHSTLLVLSGITLTGLATAAGTDLSTISNNITSTFESLGKLITAVAYISGMCMVIAGIFKFKQHKDNPQQIPMGTPITILGVGILLIFFPSIINPAGQTIFGDSKTSGGFQGGGITNATSSNAIVRVVDVA